MSLAIDDDTRMLRDTARRFVAGADSLRTLRRLRDARDLNAIARGAWDQMIALGFPGLLIPEAFGGSGLGAVAGTQVSEAMGSGLMTGPFLSSAIMGATAIAHGDSEALKADLLPRIAAGLVLAFAAEEKTRHDPTAISTIARRDGGGYRLSGRKIAVIDGNIADRLVVAAGQENDGGVILLMVDGAADGIVRTAGMGVDSQPTVEIAFDDVRAAEGALICGPAHAPALIDRIYDVGRLHLAAEMLGAAQEAFDRTVDYLKTRVQFGRPIGEFQALQHRAAILFGELEVARSVVLTAAVAYDGGAAGSAERISLAKARVGEIAKHVTTEAVQLHGGIGMTDDFDLGFFLKRVRAASERLGDTAFHAERYAQIRGL